MASETPIRIPKDQSLKSTISSQEREILRLKTSPSFRIGFHIVRAFEKPWRLLLIWFTLPLLMWKVARERWGKAPPVYSGLPMLEDIKKRRSIILFPTNGVGFGHFTRMLALARKIRDESPDTEVVFFTTMPTLHILTEEGFPAYHVSGRSHFKEMEAATWNTICEESLVNIFQIHRPVAFIFDGAFPYRGMLNSIKNRSDLLRIWMKRGQLRPGAKSIPIDSVQHFDLIIHPSDGIDEQVESIRGIESKPISPITLVSKHELLDRMVLRSRLGIPAESVLAYLQLGAGRINDIDSEIRITLDALLEYPEVHVIIGESMIGKRIEFKHERVRVLRDYPNSIYFNSFDFSIMASGYNSYHEAVRFGLPTICYPNLNTGKDNQVARARIAEEAGCMIVVKHRSKKTIKNAIEKIMDEDYRNLMRDGTKKLQSANGADEAAKDIISRINNLITE